MSVGDIEARLKKLEDAVFGEDAPKSSAKSGAKQLALSQLSRNVLLKNGQQKVAAIVGYFEIVLQASPIDMNTIKSEWTKAKFVGKYDAKLLERAITDGLVRELDGKVYDLTQKGEDFFSDLVKGGSTNG